MGTTFKLRNGSILLSTEAPGGIYNSAQLKKIAALSDQDAAIVKVTEDQRLALFVKEDKAAAIAEELKGVGLGIRHYQDGLHQPTACIGELCPEHKQDALGAAMALSEELATVSLDTPLRIGINGCARCCVPCHTLDVSVVGDEAGYKINLGGKNTQIPEMATFMAEGVPEDALPRLLRGVVDLYKTYAEPGETLQELMERMGTAKFADALKPYSQDAAAGGDDLFGGMGGGLMQEAPAATEDFEAPADEGMLTIEDSTDDELLEASDGEELLGTSAGDDEELLGTSAGDDEEVLETSDGEELLATSAGDDEELLMLEMDESDDEGLEALTADASPSSDDSSANDDARLGADDEIILASGQSIEHDEPADVGLSASIEGEEELIGFDDELPGIESLADDDDDDLTSASRLLGDDAEASEDEEELVALTETNIDDELTDEAMLIEADEADYPRGSDELGDLDADDDDAAPLTNRPLGRAKPHLHAEDIDALDEASLPDLTEAAGSHGVEHALVGSNDDDDYAEVGEESERQLEEKLAQDIDESVAIRTEDDNLQDRQDAISLLEQDDDLPVNTLPRGRTPSGQKRGGEHQADGWGLAGFHMASDGAMVLSFEGGATVELSADMLAGGSRSLRLGERSLTITRQGGLVKIEMDDGLKMTIPAHQAA